jgi:hypothetical protein
MVSIVTTFVISYRYFGIHQLSFTFNQPKPRIDYTLKAVGGSLTAIPGLSDMIDVSFLLVSKL